MVDSGASTTFIHRRFVKENNIETIALRQAHNVYNVDGTINKAGCITAAARLEMHIGDHSEVVVFPITDTGRDDVIISLDWLRQHNPAVDWESGSLQLLRCPDECAARQAQASRDCRSPDPSPKKIDAAKGDTEVRLTARGKHHEKKDKVKAGPVLGPVEAQKSAREKPHRSVTLEEVEDEGAGIYRHTDVLELVDEWRSLQLPPPRCDSD